MQVQEAELREGFKVEKKGFTLGKGVVYGGVFLKCVKWSNSTRNAEKFFTNIFQTPLWATHSKVPKRSDKAARKSVNSKDIDLISD